MNKKEFSVYLHKPHLIDKHAEIAIQEVVTDFPYFHAAHQLLLKAHQINGSYHFEKQLPVVSLLHGNRALLYEYLKHTLVKEFSEAVQEDPANSEVSIKEAGDTELLDIFKSNGNLDDNLPFQHLNEKYPTKEPNPDSNLIVEPLEVLETESLDAIGSKTLVPVEHADLIVDTEHSSEENELAVNEEAELEILVNSDKIQDGIENSTHDKELPLAMTKAEVKVIASIPPDDFLSWLQSKKKIAEAKHHVQPPSYSQAVMGDEPLEQNVNSQEIVTVESKKIKKFNALIDKFIENSPSISKPLPTKFYNPAEKAKESVTENFDLVTETLAKIYIKQSNYKKAILVYEKLSLLYPEKISYFAARISELQTLLNK